MTGVSLTFYSYLYLPLNRPWQWMGKMNVSYLPGIKNFVVRFNVETKYGTKSRGIFSGIMILSQRKFLYLAWHSLFLNKALVLQNLLWPCASAKSQPQYIVEWNRKLFVYYVKHDFSCFALQFKEFNMFSHWLCWSRYYLNFHYIFFKIYFMLFFYFENANASQRFYQ